MKLWQEHFIRYGFVCIGSTLMHVVVAFIILYFIGVPLVITDIAAFFTAMSISYIVSASCIFEAKNGVKSMGKFLVVSRHTVTDSCYLELGN